MAPAQEVATDQAGVLWVLGAPRTHADDEAAGVWALGRMPARGMDVGRESGATAAVDGPVLRPMRSDGEYGQGAIDAFTRGYGTEQWRGLVSAYGWSIDEALAVMDCESRGQPNATGGANYGLFQINAVHAARVGGDLQALYDPATNIRVAYEIWSDQGWAPWACKPW